MAPKKESKKQPAEKAEKSAQKKKTTAASKKSPTPKLFFQHSGVFKILGLFIVLFSIFLTVAFVSYCFGAWKTDDIFSDPEMTVYRILFDGTVMVSNWMGRVGAALAHLFIKQWFGIASFLFPFFFFLVGVRLLFKSTLLSFGKTFQISFLLLVLISSGLGYIFPSNELSMLGGVFGFLVNNFLVGALGKIGAGILLFFIYLTFLVLVFKISFNWLLKKKESTQEAAPGVLTSEPEAAPILENTVQDEITTIEFDLKPKTEPKEEPVIIVPEPKGKKIPDNEPVVIETPMEVNIRQEQDTELEIVETIETAKTTDTSEHVPDTETPYDPRLDLSNYKFPALELLDNYGSGLANVKKEELEENKNKIVQTLNNYSIQIDRIIATIGPTVTLYEIVPAPGIRISRIKNLEDDIALSLSAYGIRIIAPIPGKGTIGIEVPNQNPEIVSMRSIISSDKFQNNSFELPIGFGKTISNESFVTDLTKMPHLLMAGATGQGKSVGLNAIITSLLYKKHPAEIKFVMVDPKKVELTLFSKIERHFLAKLPDYEEAIITDIRKVVRMLNSLCIEMDQRYNLLKDAQVRNIKEYNTKFLSRRLNPNNGHRFLPYIVLIVDEFADLIMTAGKEIEAPITRLAQLARAIGIHLVIATQRPSVNIITGTIKANFPARLAFRVTSKIDSRTILDSGGADQLVGRGDMLLSTGNDLIRLQCAFVDIHEVERITDFIGSQTGYPDAYHLPEYYEEGDENNPKEIDLSDRDELFEEAARLIVQHQQGSTSLIQRKMKLGYNRAGRIIDQLEASGIVGPFEGSKAREVLIKDMIALEQKLRNED